MVYRIRKRRLPMKRQLHRKPKVVTVVNKPPKKAVFKVDKP